ncbi:sialate O-acetylesterase [Ereboglobus sp. PH5-5]|nr:sialate O-acetylesterase [Ereboglobus sp. PH5-5]
MRVVCEILRIMKKCTAARFLLTVVFAFALLAPLGAVELPGLFADRMVLQSGVEAPVWGKARAGDEITVTFAGQTKRARAGADGRWVARLDPLEPSAQPRELVVKGPDGETRFTDVLVGEVWLCSGQSNMEKPIGERRRQKPVFNAEEEIRAADFPQIRLFRVKKTRADEPRDDVELAAPWTVCSPDTIDAIKFSAAGYFFGRKLHTEINVPVGLIEASWGGTRIEPWTAPEGFDAVPELSVFAVAARQPGAKVENTQPSSLYNAMIYPLAPYAIRGVIWYQGESNLTSGDGANYAQKMVALVQGWRAAWKSEMPFYYVQIAPFLYHVARNTQVASPEAAPILQEAQTRAMQLLPRTGMVVTTDLVDDLFDIHPRNKRDVGERLARWALAHDYARSDVVFSGPVFQSMEVKGQLAYLTFDHVHGGLITNDGKPPRWFVIAGDDGLFYPAKAVIEGGRVILSNPKVPAPKTVRFAWDEAAQPNLFNKAGLPAVPFRMDAGK